jgi:hypothetical protein
MSKLIGFACTSLLLLLAAKPQENQFSKYKAIETYEVRPGFLIMPSYTADGQVCEIGLQRQNYATDIIHLDSHLDQEDIDQIFDQLVPVSERGSNVTGVIETVYSVEGNGWVGFAEYENVSIQIYGKVLSSSKKHGYVVNNVAASIKWKNRKCK